MALLVIGLAWIALAAPVLWLAGWLRVRSMRTWSELLGPEASDHFGYLERSVAREMRTWDATYDFARSRLDEGRLPEACRLLDIGCRTIEAFVPDMLGRLRCIAVYSRAVSAMFPVAPLSPHGFQSRGLAGLAWLDRSLHHLLVTTGERLRLKLRILVWAFKLAAGSLRSTTRDAAADPIAAWGKISDIRADLRSLNGESVESFRVLLLSLQREGLLTSADPG
jgi:hypothetical protein